MTKRLRGSVMSAFIALAVVLVAGLGMWAGQRRLIYFPDESAPSIGVMGAGWEEVTYETADGLMLGAWYRAPSPGQPVVVVFNGNAGNRAGRASLGRGLASAGLGVLLTDYRGYGGNPGHPTEAGLAADARGAVAFLREREPDHRLAYFGESLGAAVAVKLASADPPTALILRSPFTSLSAIGRVHYPWLPVAAMLKDRYPSDELIGDVVVPTLVVAGDGDAIVPFSQSRAIYEAAPGLKRLVVIPGADHNDANLVSGPDVVDEVVAFIGEVTER